MIGLLRGWWVPRRSDDRTLAPDLAEPTAPEVGLPTPTVATVCTTGEACGDRHPETGAHVVRVQDEGAVARLADDVGELGEQFERLERHVDGLHAGGSVRVQACDGLCPGDDCYLCALLADLAASQRRAREQAEARIAALEERMASLVEQRHRDALLVLARLQLALPNYSVSDELAEHSRIGDWRARERAFDELVDAVADGKHDVAESVLDLLRGGAA